jgi:hypothetical protein
MDRARTPARRLSYPSGSHATGLLLSIAALECLGLVRADLGPALGAGDQPIEDDGVEHAHGKPLDAHVEDKKRLDGPILALLFDSAKSLRDSCRATPNSRESHPVYLYGCAACRFPIIT